MYIMMMHVDVVHRNTRFLGGVDNASSEGEGDLWFDLLISQHDAFAATLCNNHAAPIGSLLSQIIPGYQASGKYKTGGNHIDASVHYSSINAVVSHPPGHNISIPSLTSLSFNHHQHRSRRSPPSTFPTVTSLRRSFRAHGSPG